MNAPISRREAHKQATRAALREAAKRLFAERGYEATTVRDIARAAQVTERTFYRYFDGKEGLAAEEALAWIGVLHDAIRERPLDEPPFEAVRRAMLDVVQRAAADAGPARFWIFTDRPRPFALLGRAAPRPLLRVEQSITDALVARTGDEREPEAELLARVAVAALRNAAIRNRRLEAERAGSSPGIQRLLADAFAMLADLTTLGAPSRRPAAS